VVTVRTDRPYRKPTNHDHPLSISRRDALKYPPHLPIAVIRTTTKLLFVATAVFG
jgi:hypothetical protein